MDQCRVLKITEVNTMFDVTRLFNGLSFPQKFTPIGSPNQAAPKFLPTSAPCVDC
jgi:hypothetical protein